MALFPTHNTSTQGSLHYRLAILGYQKRSLPWVICREWQQRCRRCTFYLLVFYHAIPRRKRTTPTALTFLLLA
ncbi:hypothetical protein [Segatella salivae]|uniref:hypothetical protein n=1 Tax=Segatella salivae TaxID=228604 RepID=UPI0012DBFF68|nr:hypothetical protein [Segatella salivae]